MTVNFTIRPAQRDDAATLAAIQHTSMEAHLRDSLGEAALGESATVIAALDESQMQEMWDRALEAGTPAWLVTEDGQAIGMAGLLPGEDPTVAEVTLEVAPAAQDQTEAVRDLLATVEEAATAQGIRHLGMWVLAESEWQIRAITTAGFTPQGTRQLLELPGGQDTKPLATHLWGKECGAAKD